MQNKTLSRDAQVTSKVFRQQPELKALEKRLGTSILCTSILNLKYTSDYGKKYLALFIPKVKSLSCLTLCDPMDCSLPDSPLHGIFQARVLEWVVFPSPGNLPHLDPGIEPRSPTLQADALPSEPLGKPIES